MDYGCITQFGGDDPRYEDTVIYCLELYDEDIDDLVRYVGHSTNITERLRQHKTHSSPKSRHKGQRNLYDTIRRNGGWDNVNVEILERRPCYNLSHAIVIEQYWYDRIKPELNGGSPCDIISSNPHTHTKNTT